MFNGMKLIALLALVCFLTGVCCVSCAAGTKVHAFYYPWYRSMPIDGNWIHWEDETHLPPDNVCAAFYPLLGPYSANDPVAINQHMKWLRDAGVGVIALSWWGPGSREDNSAAQILDIANNYGIKCCFHIEPYYSTAASAKSGVMYIIDNYGSHPGLFRDSGLSNRPIFYFFASNIIPDTEWAPAWDSLRGTGYNSAFIGDCFDTNRIVAGHWDGFYNYFPGQEYNTWNTLASWAQSHGKFMVPPVGPGWDSSQVGGYGPPTILRNRGAYYDTTWSAARAAAASYSSVRYVGITSFNEWHEGTQIEPAVPKTVPGVRTYPDYLPDTPAMYVDKTASWSAVLDPATSGKIQCEDYSGGSSAQEGVDYHDTTSGNSGGVYRTQSVDIEACIEGGYNVGWIAAGEWLRYTNITIAQTGSYEIRLRGASWNGVGQLRICDGSLSNTILTLSIANTGGTQNWQTSGGIVNLNSGAHTIYLYMDTSDINLNWFEIRPNSYSPNMPYNLGATNVTTNSIRWTWEDGSGTETGFNIYADQGTGPATTLRATTAANATYWDFTNLTPNTQYSFRVAAVNGNGESGRTTNYTRNTAPLPGPVTNFTAVGGDNQNALSWTNPTVGEYVGTMIRFSTITYPGSPSGGSLCYNGSGTSAVHGGLVNGVTYYYTAFAYDSIPNYSGPTITSGVPIDVIPPGPITGFTATAGDTQCVCNWTNPTGDYTGTIIRMKTTGFPTAPTDGDLCYQGTGTTHTHTGLTNGVTYYYSAYAYDEVPNYADAALASATPEAQFCFQDVFNYVNGPLIGLGGWTGTATSSHIDVTNSTVRVWGGSQSKYALKTINCDSNPTGYIWVRLLACAGTGTTTMWNVWINDSAGKNFARWYGTGTTARGRIGTSSTVTASRNLRGGGLWDSLVVKINPTANTTQFYYNGEDLGVYSHGSQPGSVVSEIKIERENNSGAAGNYMFIDDIRVSSS